jgi:serine protease Do
MTNGPASKAGLRAGDVIVSVQGKTVETRLQLKGAIALEKPGQVLTLNVVRAREHLAIKVQTEAWPTDDDLVEISHQPDRGEMEAPAFGLTVQALTKELADYYGVEPGTGVLVTAVKRDSSANAEGIQPGDVITKINREAVTNLKQFRQALKDADVQKGIMVNVISNGSSRLIILQGSGR